MSPDTSLCRSLIAIAAWKWGKLFNKKGISLIVSKYPKLNKKIFPIEAKSSGSYQSSVISKIVAKRKGFDDCLMLDINKNIAETTACNIFWINLRRGYRPQHVKFPVFWNFAPLASYMEDKFSLALIMVTYHFGIGFAFVAAGLSNSLNMFLSSLAIIGALMEVSPF